MWAFILSAQRKRTGYRKKVKICRFTVSQRASAGGVRGVRPPAQAELRFVDDIYCVYPVLGVYL